MAINIGKLNEALRQSNERKNSYLESRAWSDGFIPEIKKIVGPQLLQAASFEVDTTEATDLIVFKGKDLRIAARVRRAGYSDDFLWQFTIRTKVVSGGRTEWDKLVQGCADLMFYAHADADEQTFERWFLIDLSAWRAHMINDTGRRAVIWGDQDMPGGTAFRWFDLRSFPETPSILIASSHVLSQAPPMSTQLRRAHRSQS